MPDCNNRKRIIRNTLLLYFRMLFSMLISFVISRLILNILGVEDYGIYNVVGGVVVLFTFLNTAMSSASQRFLTFALGKEDKDYFRSVFSTSIWIHVLIALFILFLSETIGLWLFYNKLVIPDNRMGAAAWVYQLSVFSCMVSIVSVPYNAAIIAREKMDVYACILIFDILLRLQAVCLLPFLSFDKLKLYALALFVVSLLVWTAYWVYCKRNIREARFSFAWNSALFSEMLSFAGWNLLGNLAYIAYTQGLNILLNIFFGPVVNAARGVAVQLQGAVNHFCSSFQTALNPQITKSFASGNHSYMDTLILSSSKYSFLLLLLLALPLLVETEQVLSLWLHVVPDNAVVFSRMTLLVAMVDVLANPLIIAVQATGRIRNYQILIGGILLLILPVSYLALKMGYPPVCVFVVHFCIVVLAHGMRLWICRKLIGLSLKVYYKQVLSPLAQTFLFSVIFPLGVYSLLDVSLSRLLLVVLISWSSVLFWGYNRGLKVEERVVLKNKWAELKRKWL